MNTKDNGGDAVEHKNDELLVQVRYLAVHQPYVEPHAAVTGTLVQLKARTLTHFGLMEGDADGGRKTYSLSLAGETLTDMNVTLGSLADGKHRLEFTLVEQFIQG